MVFIVKAQLAIWVVVLNVFIYSGQIKVEYCAVSRSKLGEDASGFPGQGFFRIMYFRWEIVENFVLTSSVD